MRGRRASSAALQPGPIESPQHHNGLSSFYKWAKVNFRRWAKVSCQTHERAYAMKQHHAAHLHYDLRLEWNGVLLSWALSEGPSRRAGAIREAIEMEDLNRAHLLFEGVHETGPIMLWDRGTVSVVFWPPCLGPSEESSSIGGDDIATRELGWRQGSRLTEALLGAGDTGL